MHVAVTVQVDDRKHTIMVENLTTTPAATLRDMCAGAEDGLLADAIEYVATGEWPRR